MGMGWTAEDLEKPSILIESTFGDSHPGSAHLFELAEEARKARPSREERGPLFATDICDGMAQGHDGINYSLASREIISQLIEIHGSATPSTAAFLLPAAIRACPPT